VHTGFWWGDLREIDHLEDLDIEVKVSHYELGQTHRVPGGSGSQDFKTIGT
jgi:hypothetical protein